MSGTSTRLLPVKSAVQQGLGAQEDLPKIFVVHWVCVLMLHAPLLELQHAPMLTAHIWGEQTMPTPMNSRPCSRQGYWLAMTQEALASLQQPPLTHGLGEHAAEANQLPVQAARVDAEHPPASEQHAPLVEQGEGEQVAA